MKKILCFALAAIMLLAIVPGTALAAYTPRYEDEAWVLYEYGLFRGTGNSPDEAPEFELGRQATRIEALVMLIRLLGEEDKALSYYGRQPFTDIPYGNWAYKYVGYAYAMGYTNGVGNNRFDPYGKANAYMYVTFVLRALGYDDSRGEFGYYTSLDFAARLGMLRYGEYTGREIFYRDDCAHVSLMALYTEMNGSGLLLIEYLGMSRQPDTGLNYITYQEYTLPTSEGYTGLTYLEFDYCCDVGEQYYLYLTLKLGGKVIYESTDIIYGAGEENWGYVTYELDPPCYFRYDKPLEVSWSWAKYPSGEQYPSWHCGWIETGE